MKSYLKVTYKDESVVLYEITHNGDLNSFSELKEELSEDYDIKEIEKVRIDEIVKVQFN